jgi:hypothetical protein
MGDGLAAAIGTGDEIGRFVPRRRGAGIGLGRAADEAGPLGPAAGLAKHGACPNLGDNSSRCHRQIVRFSQPSQCLRAARKKVFL